MKDSASRKRHTNAQRLSQPGRRIKMQVRSGAMTKMKRSLFLSENKTKTSLSRAERQQQRGSAKRKKNDKEREIEAKASQGKSDKEKVKAPRGARYERERTLCESQGRGERAREIDVSISGSMPLLLNKTGETKSHRKTSVKTFMRADALLLMPQREPPRLSLSSLNPGEGWRERERVTLVCKIFAVALASTSTFVRSRRIKRGQQQQQQ